MSSPQHPPEDVLNDLLKPLRDVTPPQDVQQANRDAVLRALARRVRPPWWRRTVAVPVPALAAASLAAVCLGAWSCWLALGPVAAERLSAKRHSAVGAGELSAAPPDARRVSASGPPTEWKVTRSYLDSLDSLAHGHVSWISHATENGDES
jgi:hypothetical protein